MEELENYQDYIDQAVEWAIGIVPGLIDEVLTPNCVITKTNNNAFRVMLIKLCRKDSRVSS